MSDPTKVRPYTSYNFFFQLEREHILQNLLGHRPRIAPGDAFDPAAETYPADAPPLPRRYAGLVLPYDWHIPDKTRRRKRSHRKSHGKIGIHELNDRISKAWGVAGDDVRAFCERLSDIESRKYGRTERKVLGRKRVNKRRSRPNKPIKSKGESNGEDRKDASPSFDWTVNFPNFVQADCAKSSPRDNEDGTRLNMCHVIVSDASAGDGLSRASSHHKESLNESFNESCSSFSSFSEVDMEDGEIIAMWNSTRTEEDRSIPLVLSTCQTCVEIVTSDANASTVSVKEEEGDAEEENARTVCVKEEEGGVEEEDEDTRTSFIDAEYEKFKAIGKHFSSGPRKRILLDRLQRNSMAACQA